MTRAANVFRLEGAVGSIVGGGGLLLGHLLNLGDPATGTTAGKTLVLVGHTALVFGFVGLYVRQRATGPVPVARAGMVLGVVGTVLVSAIVFVEIAATTDVDTTPVFEAAGTTGLYAVGPLAFVLGLLLLGGSILRGDVLPRASGGLLVAGSVVFTAASVVEDLAGEVTVAGAVLTAGGLVWIGVALLTAEAPPRRTLTLGGDD